MAYILNFLLFSAFLFKNIQSESTYLLKYEKFVNAFLSQHLSDTHYCASVLSPSEYSLKKSLEATFFSPRRVTPLNEKHHIDLCCRSSYKCNAYKHMELNSKTEYDDIQHCECLHSFQICLKNLNTSLSNEVAFIHSLNATNCYSNDHKIIKCIKFETYSSSKHHLFSFMNVAEREKYLKRCTKYELDENKPKYLQIFDVPLNDHVLFMANVQADMSEKFKDMNGNKKFPSAIKTANFVFSVLKKGLEISCETYDTFFKEVPDKIKIGEPVDEPKHIKDKAHLKFILDMVHTLIDATCTNQEFIETEMTPESSSEEPSLGARPARVSVGGNNNIHIGCRRR
ncbi:uncharacterized protein LOC116336600 [Contarinia nasturtii]|uniref:uncharacterized protein LOC116336600 n=1 Tax=Contarinia nasturtii TaxID=265458 RepID=UPI0012D3FB30|nr:uncharacterized protein LOC116336600 [Contarinia nasturtii]